VIRVDDDLVEQVRIDPQVPSLAEPRQVDAVRPDDRGLACPEGARASLLGDDAVFGIRIQGGGQAVWIVA
jgi:hypothetical protein